MNSIFSTYLASLQRSETLPGSALRAYQDDLRQRLVLHAIAQCPFYRDRLSVLMKPDGTVDLSRWRDVPILKRSQVAEVLPEMAARHLPAHCGSLTHHKTSGSEGSQISFSVNSMARLAYNAEMTRLALWHRLEPSSSLAQIRIFQTDDAPRYPDGWHSKGWSGARSDSDSYLLDMRTPVEDQIEWLMRKDCRYLTTLPSNALAIAFACTPAQAKALNLAVVFSISETVLPGVREIIADRLGAKLIAIYSTEEVGIVATQCPKHPHYHSSAETTFMEIVDDDGEPVPSGTIGRVLLTGLYNYATPFIRYEIGDVAVGSDEMCDCGRTLPVIQQVLGRTRHAFVLRDGRRIWLRVWNAQEIQRLMPCKEFQLAQRGYDQFDFRFVPLPSAETNPDGLIEYLKQQLHHAAEIRLIPLDKIERGPGGKFDPFISDIKETLENSISLRTELHRIPNC